LSLLRVFPMLLVDSNNLAHMAKHSGRGLDNGVIYMFLLKLLTLCRLYQTTDVIFAWDSRKSLRRKLYDPMYKKTRIEEREAKEQEYDKEAFIQFNELRRFVLPDMGFRNIFQFTGYEADDILAGLCKDNPDISKVVVSSDHDLLQVLAVPRTVIFNPRSKKEINAQEFTEQKRIDPTDWAMVLAIAGDPGDGVVGIKGIGEKYAIRYLRKELSLSSKHYKLIMENWDIAEKNIPLVKLPLKTWDKRIALNENDITQERLRAVFSKYKFNSFLHGRHRQGWETICAL